MEGGRGPGVCLPNTHTQDGHPRDEVETEKVFATINSEKESRWGPPSLYATHFLWERYKGGLSYTEAE